MEKELILSSIPELDNSILGQYIHKIVNNAFQRRVYLKIPKKDILNGISIKGEPPQFIMKNLPKGVKFGELVGRSENHIFITLHC